MINDLKVEKKNSFLWKFADDSTLSERFQGIVQMILIIFNNGQWK
jgi:predicted RNA polymerase sigma factor